MRYGTPADSSRPSPHLGWIVFCSTTGILLYRILLSPAVPYLVYSVEFSAKPYATEILEKLV